MIQSKPGKVFIHKTRSGASPRQSLLRRLLGLWLLLALLGVSCSVGGSGPGGPYFTAPSSYATPQDGGLPPLVFPTSVSTAAPDEVPETVVSTEMVPPPGVVETPLPVPIDATPQLYYTQAGDTLPVVAVRFGVDAGEITSPSPLPATALLSPNTLLIIPRRLGNTTSAQKILPDSEVVFSPSAMDFDVNAYVNQAGGYLSTYKEWLGSTFMNTGAQVVERVSMENSINPRLLLALLEFQSGWVFGQPGNLLQEKYPLGNAELNREGLYSQLVWAVNKLSIGYYGWREGLLTDISFSDGVTARLAPDLNAGTVALQYYMAQVYDSQGWVQALDSAAGLPSLYESMYGSPWERAMRVEPLYPPDLTQPTLILPFLIGQVWSYTGGPHGAWEHDGARAALDFAPPSMKGGCIESYAWVTAMAPGLIVRSGGGLVVQDMDGDGNEHTGWVLLYLHVSNQVVSQGDWVETSDLLGNPSCEGGIATGTHVHVARKYNGEWIPADGPLPYVLSGWQAHAGVGAYEGTLTRDGITITASVGGANFSHIMRSRENP